LTATQTPKGTRPPFWRNVHFIRGVLQILAVAIVVGGILFLGNNLRSELIAKNLPTGFDFLNQPTGVTIADSGFSPASPVWKALLAGIKNTFLLVIVGIPLLTVLGTLIGVARLSTNWLVVKIATVYVETIRNIPPLLIILFVFNAVILQLPPPRDPATPLDWFVISNLKIIGPGFTALSGAGIFAGVFVFAMVAAGIAGIWRTRYSERTGHPDHRALWGLGVFTGIMVLGYFILGRPIRMSLPVLDGRIITGGYGGLGAYFAMLLALVIYTASHVAEIVRGSILAVPKGQTEAANAIALSGFQRLRYVTLPQAFRIALPPIINQFLNFAKNTSLAIAIGYAEVTLITFQLIGNGYPAPQLILLLMLAYLLFSLTISILVNILNRRLQLVGN